LALAGYGENSRVLEWVFERSAGRGDAVETPIGFVPSDTALNIEGLDVTVEDMTELLTVHHDEWRHEVRGSESTSPSSVTICPRNSTTKSIASKPGWRSSPPIAANARARQFERSRARRLRRPR